MAQALIMGVPVTVAVALVPFIKEAEGALLELCAPLVVEEPLPVAGGLAEGVAEADIVQQLVLDTLRLELREAPPLREAVFPPVAEGLPVPLPVAEGEAEKVPELQGMLEALAHCVVVRVEVTLSGSVGRADVVVEALPEKEAPEEPVKDLREEGLAVAVPLTEDEPLPVKVGCELEV